MNDGWIALMSAAEGGHLDIVKYFVNDCKVDPKTPMNDGWIALMSAAEGGHLDIVKYFVNDCKVDPRTPMNDGRTAINFTSNIELKNYLASC